MGKRQSLSKKARFEVFKRDSFTCQYCGRSAPGVVLRCDHITPVAKGGDNHITNLITACFECNAGKSDRLLSDDTVLAKQHSELALIQERRNQLTMLKQWRDECSKIDDDSVALVEAVYSTNFAVTLNQSNRRSLLRLIKQFGIEEVLSSAEIACNTYVDSEDAWSKLSGILKSRAMDRELPGLGKVPYIAAILRNRGLYIGYELRDMTEAALRSGVAIDAVIALAKTERNWTCFRNALGDLFGYWDEPDDRQPFVDDGAPSNPFGDREVW